MRRMIFIEDANITFDAGKEGRYDLGEGPDLGFLRSARKIDGNTSVILTDQVPSKLNAATIANCSNVVCFNLVQSKDVWTAGCAEGLEPHQRKELVELREREVVARLKRYRRPLKIQVDEIVFPAPLSREEARRRSKPFLDGIPYVRRHGDDRQAHKSKKEDSFAPDSKEYRTFAFIVRCPHNIAPDRQAETGLKSDADHRTIKKLQARGAIKFSGKAGSKYKLYEPTERGLEMARKLGLPPATPHKGGNAHRCLEHYTGESLRRYCPAIDLHRTGAASTVGGVQVDLLAVFPSGLRYAIQCCCQNQPDYEADQLRKLQRLTELQPDNPDCLEGLIIVAVNKAHRANVEKAVRSQPQGNLWDSVHFLDFDEVIDGYDWDQIFSL